MNSNFTIEYGGDEMKQLNVQNLNIQKDKDYTEVVFFGDVHLGSAYSDVERAQRMLDYCLEKNIYVFCMGDIMEAANRYSVGAGVYEQISPQAQLDKVYAMFADLSKRRLILGWLQGNHEFRIFKETGIDVSKIICRELRIPYLGFAGWNLWRVGNESYTIYAFHGASGARFAYTKMKSAVDIALYLNDVDVVAIGHVHDILINSINRQYVDKRNKTVGFQKCHIIVTGHYLSFAGSYAQMKGMPPGKEGSPKGKFFANKHDVHFSV